jgi:quercetin dioxygenase-like cupin family protein
VTHDIANDALALLVEPVPPPPSLRARVLAAALATRPSPGIRFVHRDDDRWEVVMPGIERRALAGGPTDRTRTFLLRLAPGARLPAHVHDAEEHLLVVAGSVEQDGRTVGTGDYAYSPIGSRHADAVTAGGCVVLVVQVTP